MIRKDETVIRIPSDHDQNPEKAVQIVASAASMIRFRENMIRKDETVIRITSVHDQNPEKAVQIVARAANKIRFR